MNRSTLLVVLLGLLVAGFAVLVAIGSGTDAAPSPVRELTPAERYTDAGGGHPVWGNRACNAVRYFGATNEQTAAWMVRQYGLTAAEAATAVDLAHAELGC